MSFIFFFFFLPSALPCQTLLFLPLTICLSFVHPIFVSLWKLTWENVLFSTLRSSSYKKRRRDRRKCQLRGGPPLSAVNTNGSSLCRQIMRFVVSSEAPSFVSWFCFPRRVNRREEGKRCCPFSSFGSSFFPRYRINRHKYNTSQPSVIIFRRCDGGTRSLEKKKLS